MIENILTWNHGISLFLNTFAEHSIIRNILPYLADVPIFSIPLFLIGYWIFATLQQNVAIKEKLLVILYTDILAGVLVIIIQQFIHVDRPLVFLQNKWVFLLSHIPDNSFPSDHATIGAAFLVAIFLFGYRKIFYYLLPFFIIMFLARIVGGVHYPLDILWGIVVGIFAGYTVFMIKNTVIFRKINQFIIQWMRKIYL